MSSTKKKHEPSAEARAKAWSPESRAKAAATRARTMAAKKAALAEGHVPLESIPDGGVHMSLDAIPDREPAKKYARKEKATYMVTEKEWMFLKMAKMLLGEQ